MALSINNNLMALTAFNNLTRSYGTLSKSISRLSSGLRITSAADDAAGLAIRELMRSDIAVLNQGIRNANDAISLLQTMDGGASIIDEKLIRMKELAEQAATGTYSSAQRAIMNEEFQAMKDEIQRIANATDFNQIKLLNGVSGTTTGAATEVQQILADVHTNAAAGSAVTTFTSFNSGDTIAVSWTLNDGSLGGGGTVTMTNAMTNTAFATAINNLTSAAFDVAFINDGGAASNTDYLQITDGTSSAASQISLVLNAGGGAAEYTAATSTAGTAGTTVSDVKIHFGTGNDSTEDYYYISSQDMTASGLGIDALYITSQPSAQAALGTIDAAILAKDTARAHFGATINRLENTVSNLTIQAENIQAGESQISDVDVAFEMTQFINTQIKSQAAVAMLAQANTMPQMAITLLQGA
jgi:flagellin